MIGAAAINIIAHGLEGVTDAIIILAVVLINAVVGVVQESKAEKALEALQQMTTPKSAVKRNGRSYRNKFRGFSSGRYNNN